MPLRRDRELVEVFVYGRGRRCVGLITTTRYVMGDDGSLVWVHPFDKTKNPERHTAAPDDWRKVKPSSVVKQRNLTHILRL